MPLNLFYTMVQKSQKRPKTQIKGGGGPALSVQLQARLALKRCGRSRQSRTFTLCTNPSPPFFFLYAYHLQLDITTQFSMFMLYQKFSVNHCTYVVAR